MYLRYSSSVVAPTQCSSPRASAGFSMLPASIAPSALPAPTMVCSSSMKTMVLPVVLRDLLQHRLQPLLELAAVLGAGEQRRHVERQHALALERLGHFAVDDALREAFDDRGLAHARLADQHRIVLGAALQDLDHAADLVVAADDRVELARAGALGEIERVFLERLALRLRLPGSATLSPPRTALIACSSACAVRAVLLEQPAGLALVLRQRQAGTARRR